MLKILAVGNSFSEDAVSYLPGIASADGRQLLVGNLVIGGCSLQKHFENLQSGAPEYTYYENGQAQTDVSSEPYFKKYDWDIVTLQQASHFSGIEETYYPYIEEMAAYIRSIHSEARIFVHETWAYETDSTHGAFPDYGCDQQKMYTALAAAYSHAAERIDAKIIPCGDVIQALRGTDDFNYAKGAPSLCRDGFHMHLYYGRYAAAATWYETLTGENILNNTFLPSPELADGDESALRRMEIIKKTVHGICGG